MNEAERRLDEDRTNRRKARGLFDRRLAQVKADYEARGIGDRIKAKARDESLRALDQALDVASESKGIIAATLATLALWIFRAPLFSLARRAFSPAKDKVQKPAASDAGEDSE